MSTPTQLTESTKTYKEAIIVFALATTAALFIKLPDLLGFDTNQNEVFYIRNFSFFVLPLLVIYFTWKRSPGIRTLSWLTFAFVAAILFANTYPFETSGDTIILTSLNMPIALWLLVGIAYTGGKWNQISARMDFIRFSGELFIYYVLIALGGGVLMALMAFIFQTIAIDIEPLFESWILPCGSVGAVIIAAWLVEIIKGAAENFAPMLARLFTPLFAVVLLSFLGTLIWTGRTMEIERDVLIALDLLLVVVLGLLLYSISARRVDSTPGIIDFVRIVLLVSALIVDLIALWSIGGRISELGLTPNRIVALGLNLILLINLSGSALLYIRYILKQGSYNRLEKWQSDYLPVYAIWAALVVIFIPPLFSYA
ncbi:MAG: hypothetical protein RI575_03050 [Balneolaceae bacterium]|nr:hypothetical protein [Balneolaceae bacterium]MDR9417237.1 hypothetical protein [Gracilimonas sp.]